MLTRETAIEQAKSFLQKCKEQNINITKAILFGSVVNGNLTEDSDIDLLLVSDLFGTNRWDNAKILANINKNFSSIDAHPFPTEYFITGDPFINEIKKYGLEIH
jgi:predicted nucleotidyltransferase